LENKNIIYDPNIAESPRHLSGFQIYPVRAACENIDHLMLKRIDRLGSEFTPVCPR
jgi:hypothetical protein